MSTSPLLFCIPFFKPYTCLQGGGLEVIGAKTANAVKNKKKQKIKNSSFRGDFKINIKNKKSAPINSVLKCPTLAFKSMFTAW